MTAAHPIVCKENVVLKRAFSLGFRTKKAFFNTRVTLKTTLKGKTCKGVIYFPQEVVRPVREISLALPMEPLQLSLAVLSFKMHISFPLSMVNNLLLGLIKHPFLVRNLFQKGVFN